MYQNCIKVLVFVLVLAERVIIVSNMYQNRSEGAFCPPQRSSCSRALTWGRVGLKLFCCLLCCCVVRRVGRGWVAGGSRGCWPHFGGCGSHSEQSCLGEGTVAHDLSTLGAQTSSHRRLNWKFEAVACVLNNSLQFRRLWLDV